MLYFLLFQLTNTTFKDFMSKYYLFAFAIVSLLLLFWFFIIVLAELFLCFQLYKSWQQKTMAPCYFFAKINFQLNKLSTLLSLERVVALSR